jgi:hypothetical protein
VTDEELAARIAAVRQDERERCRIAVRAVLPTMPDQLRGGLASRAGWYAGVNAAIDAAEEAIRKRGEA